MLKITGNSSNEKVKLNLQDISELTKKGITNALYKIGNDLKIDVKKEILKKPKRGRLYLIKGLLHRASAPGEAPANLSGALEKAIDFDVVGTDRIEFGVRDKVKYGKKLELGGESILGPGIEVTRSGVLRKLSAGKKLVSPRPYLLPAIKKNYNKIEKHFQHSIKNSIWIK